MPQKKQKQEEQIEEQPLEEAPEISVGILDLSADEIANAQGYHVVEAGTYEIELIGLTFQYSKNLAPMCKVDAQPVVEDDSLIQWVTQYVLFPTQAMDSKMRKLRNNDVKELALGFGIPIQEFIEVAQAAFTSIPVGSRTETVQVDDYNGLRSGAILSIEESEGYRPKNRIVQFLAL
jgi:hypothetical protein